MFVDTTQIANHMKQEGFGQEHLGDQMFLVRPSETPGLYERLELVSVGRSHDALVLSLALSVVRRACLDLRGLHVRTGIPEACTDPDNGRVIFSSQADFDVWVGTLAKLAPARLRDFSSTDGASLLHATHEARQRANAAYESALHEASGSRIDAARLPLSDQQKREISSMLQQPPVIGPGCPEAEHRAALSILMFAGELTPLGGPAGERSTGRAMLPTATMWVIRLLVDRLLEAQ